MCINYPEHLNPFSSDYEDDDEDESKALEKEVSTAELDSKESHIAESLPEEHNVAMSLYKEDERLYSDTQDVTIPPQNQIRAAEITNSTEKEHETAESLFSNDERLIGTDNNAVTIPLKSDTTSLQVAKPTVKQWNPFEDDIEDKKLASLHEKEVAESIQQAHEELTPLHEVNSLERQNESRTKNTQSLPQEAAEYLQHKEDKSTFTALKQNDHSKVVVAQQTDLQEQNEVATSLHQTVSLQKCEQQVLLRFELTEVDLTLQQKEEDSGSLENEKEFAAPLQHQKEITSTLEDTRNMVATSSQHQQESQAKSKIPKRIICSMSVQEYEDVSLHKDPDDAFPRKPPRAVRSVSLCLPKRTGHNSSTPSVSPVRSKFGKTRMAPSPPEKLTEGETLTINQGVTFCNGRSASFDNSESLPQPHRSFRKTSLNNPPTLRSILRPSRYTSTQSAHTSQSSINTTSSLQTPCDSETSILSFKTKGSLKSAFSFRNSPRTRTLSTSKSAPQLPSLMVKRMPSLKRFFRTTHTTKFS